MALLEIANLTKIFNNNIIAHDVNFTINKGEVYCLIGLNGAGKTTILKMMLNIVIPTSGIIKFIDNNITSPLAKQNIFYLPERFTPDLCLTGLEFLKITVSAYYQPLDTAKLNRCCELLNFDPKNLSLAMKYYSNGMMQKIGLISCFACKVGLLILDEPMANLDVKAKNGLKQLLIDFTTQNGTCLFTAHTLSDIEDLCHKIIILHQNRIHFIGQLSAMKQQYDATSLEKAFLKLINFH